MYISKGLTKLSNLLQDQFVKRIVKNSAIVLFGNTTATVINLISIAIIARVLGPEALAVLVLSQTYALIINDIFNIQTWETMVKFGSNIEHQISNVIKTNLLLDVASAVIAFLFAFLTVGAFASFFGWESEIVPIIRMYTLSILFNITTMTIGIPRLFNRFFAIAKIQVASAVIKIISILITLYFGGALATYIGIYLVADILVNVSITVYSIVILKEKYGAEIWAKGKKFNPDQIRFIWWSNLRTIIRIPVRHFDMIVISSILSLKMVGIYKIYKEVAGMINRIGDPINQAIFPEFTRLIGKEDEKNAKHLAKRTIMLMSLVSITITASILILGKYILLLFFGSEYLVEIEAFYFLLILFGISFITVPINSLFIAAGFAKYSFYIVVFTNITYLFIAFHFGKIYGIYGIISAYAVQMVFNQGLKIILMKKFSAGWNKVIR